MSRPQALIFGTSKASPQATVDDASQGDSKETLEQALQMGSDSDKDKDIDPKTGRLILPEIVCRTNIKYGLDIAHQFKESEKEHLKRLTNLTLPWRLVLGPDDCLVLAAFLKKYCPILKSLTISNAKSFEMLRPFIDSTSTIQVLELFNASEFGWDFSALGEILKTNTSLRTIVVQSKHHKSNSLFYGPLIDAFIDNTTLLEIEGLNLELMVATEPGDNGSYHNPQLRRTVTYAECNQNVAQVKKAFARNRGIQYIKDLRNDIQSLFLDAPLKAEASDSKSSAEEFDIKTYEAIRTKISLSEYVRDHIPDVRQELLDELMIARCSWNNDLRQDLRIKELTAIIKRNSDPKEKALAYLAQVHLNKGTISASLGQTMEADNDYMLAFSYALHGEDNHMKKGTIIQALSLLFKDINPKEDLRALLEDLARVDAVKYEALKWIYQMECRRFKLRPFDENDLQETASSSSDTDKASRGDSKQAAEAAGQMQSKGSAVAVGKDSAASATSTSSLSLDEDDTTSVDGKTLREDTELQRHRNKFL